MNKKLHRFLRHRRPVALAMLAIAVAFLAVASAWAFQTVGDHLIFGPAIFGGAGESGTPNPTATTTSTATATNITPSTPTATATLTTTATPPPGAGSQRWARRGRSAPRLPVTETWASGPRR